MNNDARGLLLQAEKMRESADFKKALSLLGDAIITILAEKKDIRLVDALCSQSLVYRHLYDQTASDKYLILAKHASNAAVEIAKKEGDASSRAIAFYNLGKVLENLEEYDLAMENYTQAVALDVPRVAMQLEMRTRLCVLEYRKGDLSAMGRFEKAVEELKASEDKDNYAKNVWLSGAYLHMADVLIEKEKEKAQALLEQASKVIASDMRLKLRKLQLVKLEKRLNA